MHTRAREHPTAQPTRANANHAHASRVGAGQEEEELTRHTHTTAQMLASVGSNPKQPFSVLCEPDGTKCALREGKGGGRAHLCACVRACCLVCASIHRHDDAVPCGACGRSVWLPLNNTSSSPPPRCLSRRAGVLLPADGHRAVVLLHGGVRPAPGLQRHRCTGRHVSTRTYLYMYAHTCGAPCHMRTRTVARTLRRAPRGPAHSRPRPTTTRVHLSYQKSVSHTPCLERTH